VPLLKIQINVEYPEAKRGEMLKQISASVADMLGKPERYVMISLEINPHMLFAGEQTPLAYLELKSIGLPGDRTRAFSDTLCALISDHLGIASERIYIEFSDAARHMWGWNGGTF
jgi:phenylpyruvate tautomerase PptA (4-oxalocrotonate tautomerase family)